MAGVIGYLRVSTEEQADSRAGLEAQRAAILAEAERRGWHLVELIEDAGYSGKDLHRPGIATALEAMRAHRADTLVVAKLDRLSRSILDFASLMDRATREHWALVALDLGVDPTTPAGEAMANVLAVFSQFERRLIGQRTKEALAQRRASGVRLGRPPVLSDLVRERIRRERDTGKSLATIAAGLNEDAVPTAQGGRQWYPSTVRAVLGKARAGSSPSESSAEPRASRGERPLGSDAERRTGSIAVSVETRATAAGFKSAKGSFALSTRVSAIVRGLPGSPGTLIGDLVRYTRVDLPEPERLAAGRRLVARFPRGAVFVPAAWSKLRRRFDSSRESLAMMDADLDPWGSVSDLDPWGKLLLLCLPEAARGADASRPVDEWFREVRRRLRGLIEFTLLERTVDSELVPIPESARSAAHNRTLVPDIHDSRAQRDWKRRRWVKAPRVAWFADAVVDAEGQQLDPAPEEHAVDEEDPAELPAEILALSPWRADELLAIHAGTPTEADEDHRLAQGLALVSADNRALAVAWDRLHGDPKTRRELASLLRLTPAAVRQRVHRGRALELERHRGIEGRCAKPL